MSGYLGSIGFALLAALGAWAAVQEDHPLSEGRPAVSVSGDGGFGRYMAELNTVVLYGINITHILLRNDELGKIGKEQRSGSWPVWQAALRNPGFVGYAELCGAMGVRVNRKEELDDDLATAPHHAGPRLVEIISEVEFV